MTSWWKSIISHLEEVSVEKRVTASGAMLFDRAPLVGPEAWVHSVYPVLTESELNMFQKQLDLQIPEEYLVFLTECSNGLSLYLDSLSLYGIRKNIGRNIENVWQPYSIFTPNVEERISNADPKLFFFGGYNWDGSLLYFDQSTNLIHRCSNESIEPLNTWSNFGLWLSSEVNRISLLFYPNGVQKNNLEPTIPEID